VLDLIASGATNAAVAEALVVSPGTVKKHLDNIYARLDVGSRTAAAARAYTRPRTSLSINPGSALVVPTDRAAPAPPADRSSAETSA